MSGSTIPWPLPPTQAQAQTGQPGGTDTAGIIKAAQAAASPIPGGHQLGIPGSLQYNPKQWQDTPKDNKPVLGRKAANAKGFENAMISVGSLIGSVKTAKDNKEKLQIATSTQQVLQATQAKDEATQALKQAQASGDQDAIKLAQDQISHNDNIIKGVMSDEKTWKAMQKGFNINYTDPQSNNTLQHQGVQQGKQMALTDQQLQSRADAFEKSLPTQYGPNQQAIAQFEAMKAQAKQQADFAKAVAPAQIRAAGQSAIEAARLSQALQIKQAEITESWNKMMQEQQFKVQNMATEQKNMMGRIWAEGNKQIQVDQVKMNMVANDPNTIMKSADESSNKWSEMNNRVQTQISTLQGQLSTPGIKPEQAAPIQEQLNLLKGYDDEKGHHSGVLEEQQKQAAQASTYWTIKKQALGLVPPTTGDGNGTGSNSGGGPSAGATPSTPANPSAAINGWQGAAYLNSVLPGKAQ